MFVRENEFLWEVKNIAEELMFLQKLASIQAQGLRLLELHDKWQKLESPRSDESSYLMRYLSPRNGE